MEPITLRHIVGPVVEKPADGVPSCLISIFARDMSRRTIQHLTPTDSSSSQIASGMLLLSYDICVTEADELGHTSLITSAKSLATPIQAQHMLRRE